MALLLDRRVLGLLVFLVSLGREGLLWGQPLSRTFDLKPFSNISVTGSVDIDYVQGPVQSVKVRAEDDVFDDVRVEVKGDTLEFEAKVFQFFKTCPESCAVRVEIVSPRLESMKVNGAAFFTGRGIHMDRLVVDLNGSVQAKLLGKARVFKVHANGSAILDASEFDAREVSVETNGDVETDLNVSHSLNVVIAGSGTVRYRGQPVQIKTDVAGSGHVISQKL